MKPFSGKLKITAAFAIVAWMSAGALPATAQQPAAEARRIIAESGVKGGLVVHLGCGNQRLTAALRANDSYLVHGLDTDAAEVKSARDWLRGRTWRLYGQISVDRLIGTSLPYIDNTVNLLVVEEPSGVSRAEFLRVVRPNGVVCIKTDDGWEKIVKPRPEAEDDWTHYLHGPDGNPVSHDLAVGPPRHLQWVGKPRWSRHHDHTASMVAMVSANGRLFSIIDEGSTASIRLPAKISLVARDAYNGVVLWKRPITNWSAHIWGLKAGPAQLTRRLVASGDRVYVTLGLNEPVTALDAVSGETLMTYEGTESTEEIILSDGVLFLMAKERPVQWGGYRQLFSFEWDNSVRSYHYHVWDEDKDRRLMAIQAESGVRIWTANCRIAPMTLAADSRRAYVYDGERVVGRDRRTGEQEWKSEKVGRRSVITVNFGPRLIVHEDVVAFAGGDRSMTAFSSIDGRTLWGADHPASGHHSLEDLLIMDGLVWSGDLAQGRSSGAFTGRDLHTGAVKNEFTPDVKTYWFHHRCYPSKATDKYLLPSRTGIEFVDPETRSWETHHWVRGGCLYGIMPCNGLVYTPPNSCACYIEAKLSGFNALAPSSESRKVPVNVPDSDRLERGPAYSSIGKENAETAGPDDWPTYRHDMARSGRSNSTVSSSIGKKWSTNVGDRLSGVVVANGRVYVSSIDTHTIYAYDTESGNFLWYYTTGGRIDSPPTIYQGRVLFGSADGHVYCLRASDGELAWRFRAAPVDRRLVAYGQVESVWPVHGSVLVQDGAVYFVAGRSMFIDGGMRLIKLDPSTGRKISETILDDRDPDSGENLQVHVNYLHMPVSLPDVLSSNGKQIFMRSQTFDIAGKRDRLALLNVSDQSGEGAHLFCPTGFLDDTQFHRSYWIWGKAVANGHGGWTQAGRLVPGGRIMVFDDSNVYAYGRKPEFFVNGSVLEFQLFSAVKGNDPEIIAGMSAANELINSASDKPLANSSDWKLRQSFPQDKLTATQYNWQVAYPPMKARAMALAGDRLVVAGPPDLVDEMEAFYNPDDPKIIKALAEQDFSLQGKRGAILWIVSTEDGKILRETELESAPVFDGMAVAGGKVYIATMDGTLICMGD